MTERNEKRITLSLAAERVAKFLKEKGFEVLYVSLYGSQNYEMDTPDSDRDWKAVVLPSLEDVIRNTAPKSSDYEFEGGLVDVKDIRLMFNCYKKQNVNFMETLFTPYRWENSTYTSELCHLFTEVNQKVAFADPVRALKCMVGMSKEKQHALCHPYPSKLDLIEKYGYDGKQLSHALRFNRLIQDYIVAFNSEERPLYRDLLVPKDALVRDYLRRVKKMECLYPVQAAKVLMDGCVRRSEELVNDFISSYTSVCDEESAYAELEDIKVDCMMKYFRLLLGNFKEF